MLSGNFVFVPNHLFFRILYALSLVVDYLSFVLIPDNKNAYSFHRVLFIWSAFFTFVRKQMITSTFSYGEGGPRNGGWGPAGRRSFAAAGFCFLRPDGLRDIFFLFFRGSGQPFSPQCLIRKNTEPIICLNSLLKTAVILCLSVFCIGRFPFIPTSEIIIPTVEMQAVTEYPDNINEFGAFPDFFNNSRLLK